ncbi:Npun_F0296 family exosortase-dependent surface protein [Paludisphaera rhizosphaerae]|uniref:Npun_F0296 family exosortase-dependent surface protein n=1 Tax=Paludisphaera rhizosphaerae TaxID=2711216 RepID=UPI0013EC90D9|nr:PEP-CTERM sorting domain-containing protein [Paludisphaera rhizosphaerae]
MSLIVNAMRWGVAAAAVIGVSAKSASAGVIITPSAAGVQTTSMAGAATEMFNSITPNTYTTLSTAVGTLTSSGMQVMSADQYGGAGGVGNYLGITGGNPVTLTLYYSQEYVGLWWSAADNNNSLTVNTTLGSRTLTRADLPTASAYYGNPNPPSGRNTGEQYVYVNLTTSVVGERITSLVFSNGGSGSGTIFEVDNISVTTVPEPSSLALAGVASAAAAISALRRSRRRG